MIAIRWYQGRIVEALPMLSGLVDSPTLSTVDNSSLAALAVAAATAGDQPTATSALARLYGHDLADLPRVRVEAVRPAGASASRSGRTHGCPGSPSVTSGPTSTTWPRSWRWWIPAVVGGAPALEALYAGRLFPMYSA